MATNNRLRTKKKGIKGQDTAEDETEEEEPEHKAREFSEPVVM